MTMTLRFGETLDLYLTEEGYNVETAETGTDGLNKYVKDPADVVILDVRLPGCRWFFSSGRSQRRNEKYKGYHDTLSHMGTTINAMKGGADYIQTVNVDELDIAIKKH